MPNGIREPQLPPQHTVALANLIAQLDEALRMFVPTTARDPRLQRGIEWLSPTERFGLATDLARQLAEIAHELNNGARVRDAAEVSSWRASAERDDESMIAKFSGGDRAKAATVRSALDAYERLAARGAFGVALPSRESYVRAALSGGARVVGS